MATLPAWFVAPPPLNTASTGANNVNNPTNHYVVVEATTMAEYDAYKAEGAKGPYATEAAAQDAADGQTAKAKSTESNLPAPSLSDLGETLGITGISGTNLVIRTLKVVIGGTLLLVGIVHLAGIDSGSIATLARKVPIPV
jgi:hypothetical protein